MSAPSTHRATRENGPSVVNGNLIWTSATGITTADPNSFGGCTRKWWYDHVAGEKAPATKAMLGGTELHTEVENYLRFGTSLQTPLALSGSMFIPQPGAGLHIEHPIYFQTAGGVGIYGHVDLYNFRGWYIDNEGDLQRDPPRAFEVKDWKTTSDLQYAKSEHELGSNVQLVTYAEAGFRLVPDAEHARMTHVYFRTRGAPASKLVTIRRTRQEIASRWQYSESVVRTMTDVAREPTAETVPGLRKACDAYRGCPHRSKCSVYKFDALNAVYGKIGEDHANNSTGWGVEPAPQPKVNEMGLLANNPQMMNTAPQQAQPDMRQQLAAEEAQQRQQVAQQQQQMPQAFDRDGFQQACIRLQGYGYGFPTLAGNAAQAYASIGGQNIAPGVSYPGMPAPAGARRSMHGIQLTEVAHVYQLESELAAERAKEQPTPQAAPVMMQQAPLAPQMQTYQVTQTPTYTKTMDAPGLSFLPPDAPQSMPQLAMQGGPQSGTAQVQPNGTINYTPPVAVQQQYVPQAQTAPDPMKEAPKAKGRPKKTQDAAPGPTAASAQGAPPSSPSAPATQVAPVAASAFTPVPGLSSAAQLQAIETASRSVASGTPIDTGVTRGLTTVLVNARSSKNDTRSLNEYVDYINRTAAERYNVAADGRKGILDVRAGLKDTVLAFGGWPGVVRELVKAEPPPEGRWHLDTNMDAVAEAVADALRVVADVKGWDYFRGMRG